MSAGGTSGAAILVGVPVLRMLLSFLAVLLRHSASETREEVEGTPPKSLCEGDCSSSSCSSCWTEKKKEKRRPY